MNVQEVQEVQAVQNEQEVQEVLRVLNEQAEPEVRVSNELEVLGVLVRQREAHA